MSDENKAECQFAYTDMCDASAIQFPAQFGAIFPKLPLPRIWCEQGDFNRVLGQDNEPAVLFTHCFYEIFDHSDRPVNEHQSKRCYLLRLKCFL